MNSLLVSAADAGYFSLLRGLVSSVRDGWTARDLPIAVLDLGLEPEQRSWLAARVQHIVSPDWMIDFPARDTTQETFKAQACRPFLPDLFPSADRFLWMDADAWVQNPDAISLYLDGAADNHIAITPEVHSVYENMYRSAELLGRIRTYRLFFGDEAAQRCGTFPTINSGVFAMHRDAPHWAHWADALRSALQRTPDSVFFYVEQLALNYAIYSQDLPARFMPPRLNWMCHQALPALAPDGTLVDPTAPFDPLWVVHMTVSVKEKARALPRLDPTGTYLLDPTDGDEFPLTYAASQDRQPRLQVAS